MSPLHKGITTRDPKRTTGKNHEASLCPLVTFAVTKA